MNRISTFEAAVNKDREVYDVSASLINIENIDKFLSSNTTVEAKKFILQSLKEKNIGYETIPFEGYDTNFFAVFYFTEEHPYFNLPVLVKKFQNSKRLTLKQIAKKIFDDSGL